MDPSPVCDFYGRSRVVITSPSLVGQPEIELDEKFAARIGKSAGAICRTLNLPYVPQYQSIIAYTTVWQSEDRASEALVSPDGTIQLQPRL